MNWDGFYIVEVPSFHGGSGREYIKCVDETELLQYVNEKNAIVYRVDNEPMMITAELTLKRRGVVSDKAVDSTEVQT